LREESCWKQLRFDGKGLEHCQFHEHDAASREIENTKLRRCAEPIRAMVSLPCTAYPAAPRSREFAP
jgi:hypothetical protein